MQVSFLSEVNLFKSFEHSFKNKKFVELTDRLLNHSPSSSSISSGCLCHYLQPDISLSSIRTNFSKLCDKMNVTSTTSPSMIAPKQTPTSSSSTTLKTAPQPPNKNDSDKHDGVSTSKYPPAGMDTNIEIRPWNSTVGIQQHSRTASTPLTTITNDNHVKFSVRLDWILALGLSISIIVILIIIIILLLTYKKMSKASKYRIYSSSRTKNIWSTDVQNSSSSEQQYSKNGLMYKQSSGSWIHDYLTPFMKQLKYNTIQPSVTFSTSATSFTTNTATSFTTNTATNAAKAAPTKFPTKSSTLPTVLQPMAVNKKDGKHSKAKNKKKEKENDSTEDAGSKNPGDCTGREMKRMKRKSSLLPLNEVYPMNNFYYDSLRDQNVENLVNERNSHLFEIISSHN